jgi:phosphohistidine phosphatase
MNLYIIRHAEAVPLETEGVSSDAERYLTPAGQASLPPLARTFRRIQATFSRILTSPLVRAKQTAEGIVKAWGGPAPRLSETELLAPGAKKKDLILHLRELGEASVAIVGHNPDLSELIGWLIGDKDVGINLEKAGVALVEFDSEVDKGTGHLTWLITPAWLG